MNRYLKRRWERAVRYARSGKVLEMQMDRVREGMRVLAKVMSSAGGRYDVDITIAGKKLVAGKCTCSDCRTGEIVYEDITGFCKHQGATFIQALKMMDLDAEMSEAQTFMEKGLEWG